MQPTLQLKSLVFLPSNTSVSVYCTTTANDDQRSFHTDRHQLFPSESAPENFLADAIATTYISFQTPGTVMWEGQSWQAYCEENISIRQGQSVVVLARYGRSLLVQPE